MLFLTHSMCGSAWLADVLQDHYADRVRKPVYHSDRSDEFPDDPTAYACCVLTNAHYPFLRERISRAVHVIRNPLAIVVSASFSDPPSQPIDLAPQGVPQRERPRGLSTQDELRATLELVSRANGFGPGAVGPLFGLAHFDYDDPRILTIRMEDLVAYPAVVLSRAFEFLGEQCPTELLDDLEGQPFAREFRGRRPGDDDPAARSRPVNPFDWGEHLSFDAARAIYEEHANVMDRFYQESATLLGGVSPRRSARTAEPIHEARAPVVHGRPAQEPVPDGRLRWEKVIHYHLPKTGGTSLNRWLDMAVPSGRARPPERGEVLSREPAPQPALAESLSRAEHDAIRHVWWHSHLGREARGHWSVIHDHAPGILTTDRSAYRIVVLRDPIERFLSFLRDWRRLNDADLVSLPPDRRALRKAAHDLDVNAFVQRFSDHEELPQLTQTWTLANAAAFVLPDTAGTGLLGVAQDALARLFDLVGITERMDLVAQCIASDLGLPAAMPVGRWNAGVGRKDGDVLTAETRARLEVLLADDLALYAAATARFNDLLRRLETHPYGEQQFEERFLRERLARLVPRFMHNASCFSFDDAIVGSGFHGREGQGTDEVCVWTGPGTRSVLYCPVPSGEEIHFFIDLGGAITPAVRESLRIRIDGRMAEIWSHVGPTGLERVLAAVKTTRDFVKVELEVTSTHSSRELGYPGQDARLLGLNLRGYGFCLAPQSPAMPTMLGMPVVVWERSLQAVIAPPGPKPPVIPRRARATADDVVLDDLSRELDAIETRCRMDGRFERIEPFIIDREQGGKRFRIVIFNRQTQDFLSPSHKQPWLELLDRGFLKPGDTAFDIGSGPGYISVWIALAVGWRGRVVAFDPYPWNAAAARANAALNGLDAMKVVSDGLSNRPSVRRLWNELSSPIDVPWCPDVIARFDPVEEYACEAPSIILMHAAGEEHALSQADWSRFSRLERMLVAIDPADYAGRNRCPQETLVNFARHGFLVRSGSPGAAPVDPTSVAIEAAGLWFLEQSRKA